MDHITKYRDVEGQPGGLDATRGKGSSLGGGYRPISDLLMPAPCEKCSKCGETKVIGEPCIPCWDREAKEDMEPLSTAPPPEVRVAGDPRVCGVAAPCGSPCMEPKTTAPPEGLCRPLGGCCTMGQFEESSNSGVEVYLSSDYSTGWICPKCGNVYGPNTMGCWNCNQSLKVTCGT